MSNLEDGILKDSQYLHVLKYFTSAVFLSGVVNVVLRTELTKVTSQLLGSHECEFTTVGWKGQPLWLKTGTSGLGLAYLIYKTAMREPMAITLTSTVTRVPQGFSVGLSLRGG